MSGDLGVTPFRAARRRGAETGARGLPSPPAESRSIAAPFPVRRQVGVAGGAACRRREQHAGAAGQPLPVTLVNRSGAYLARALGSLNGCCPGGDGHQFGETVTSWRVAGPDARPDGVVLVGPARRSSGAPCLEGCNPRPRRPSHGGEPASFVGVRPDGSSDEENVQLPRPARKTSDRGAGFPAAFAVDVGSRVQECLHAHRRDSITRGARPAADGARRLDSLSSLSGHGRQNTVASAIGSPLA